MRVTGELHAKRGFLSGGPLRLARDLRQLPIRTNPTED
jgi:hypothetical protein